MLIYDHGFQESVFENFRTQELPGLEINLASQQIRKFCLDPEKVQTWRMPDLKFNQDIHITIWSKIITHD